MSQLRRSAFDRGSVLGREFFLTKGKDHLSLKLCSAESLLASTHVSLVQVSRMCGRSFAARSNWGPVPLELLTRPRLFMRELYVNMACQTLLSRKLRAHASGRFRVWGSVQVLGL